MVELRLHKFTDYVQTETQYTKSNNLLRISLKDKLQEIKLKKGFKTRLKKRKSPIIQNIGKNFGIKKKRNARQNYPKYRLLAAHKKGKKKIRHQESILITVLSTQNNTIYTVSNHSGKTHFCISTGMCGFKNSRKSTSYASQKAAEKLFALLKKYRNVHIKMKGLGPGKLSGVRMLYKLGLKISNIRECTTLPHNGCRPPKPRRL